MQKFFKSLWWILRICMGCALFGLGFNLFLVPNHMNAGGISGLSMILVRLLGFGTVGTVTALINLPLFALAGIKIGKTFFIGSLIGMIASSTAMDVFSILPVPETEPLLGAIYGGVLCGLGLGTVFVTGASTGGSDIIVRLLRRKMQNIPLGTINMCFDLTVALLTGLSFHNMESALYSGIAIFITGKIIDAVVYRFDYSYVALIISEKHNEIVKIINVNLDRGATYLHGKGTYTCEEREVILTAVKKQQIADLKRMVAEADPKAFIILQEAHQVLGDGFGRYSRESL